MSPENSVYWKSSIGSCFELPEETLKMIKEIIAEKQIHCLFFESHWMYRKHLQKMRGLYGISHYF